MNFDRSGMNILEINQKIAELLQKIKEGPPYQTPTPERYRSEKIQQLREVLEGLSFPVKMIISLNWRSKNGKPAGVLIREVTVKRIRVLKTGWVEIGASGPQHPPLKGWPEDFNQIEIIRGSK